MKIIQSICAGALVVAGLSSVAQAEDPKSGNLTVYPSTGASLAMSAKDKRGVLAYDYRQLSSGFRFSGEASAPLDEDTRVAAFLKENQLVGGFNANIYLGYDSASSLAQLGDKERGLEDEDLCAKVGKELSDGGCDPDEVAAWGGKHPTDKSWLEYVRALDKRMDQSRALRLLPAASGRTSKGNQGKEGTSVRWAIGVDVSWSYDRLSVYRTSVSKPPSDLTKYELSGGVNFTVYLHPSLSINLRGGGSFAQDPNPQKIERCTSVASDNTEVTGKACKPALFLAKEPGEGEGSAYARMAITFVAQEKQYGGFPGLELRAGLEQLAQKPTLNMRLIGFFMPELGPAAARFGIGVDLSNALVDDKDNEVSKGDLTFTPFVLVGGSPTKW